MTAVAVLKAVTTSCASCRGQGGYLSQSLSKSQWSAGTMNLGDFTCIPTPVYQPSHSPSVATRSQPRGTVLRLLSTKQTPQWHFTLQTSSTEKFINHKAGGKGNSLLVREGGGSGNSLASSPDWQLRSHHLQAELMSGDAADTAIKKPNLSCKGEEFHCQRVSSSLTLKQWLPNAMKKQASLC